MNFSQIVRKQKNHESMIPPNTQPKIQPKSQPKSQPKPEPPISSKNLTTSNPVKHIKLPDPNESSKLAFTYDNLLNKSECEYLINLAETEIGFSKDHNQFYNKIGRFNSRATRITPKFADNLYKRVQNCLPEFWYWKYLKDKHGHNSKWRIMGVSEFVRFYKYEPGDYFKIHRDGAFVRDNKTFNPKMNFLKPNIQKMDMEKRIGERSFITFIVYLNEGFEGGETPFFHVNSFDRKNREVKPGVGPPPVLCVPEIGKALIFQHDILHQGNEVFSGLKYAMRMDVMYARVDECGKTLPKNYQEAPLPLLEEDGGICIEKAVGFEFGEKLQDKYMQNKSKLNRDNRKNPAEIAFDLDLN